MTAVHPIAPEQIMALLDGELSAEHARSVSVHIEACARCRQEREFFGGVSQSLSSWTVPPAPAPPSFEKRLSWAAPHVPAKSSFWTRTLESPHWTRAACALCVLGVAGWLGLTFLNKSAHAPRTTTRTVGVIGGAGRQSAISELNAKVADAYLHDETSALKEGPRPSIVREEQETERLGRYDVAQVPLIARTASISVVVKDFAAARTALDAILERHRGYAGSLTASTEPNSPRSLQASLRIPAAELSTALAELKSLGQVENETQGGEEVTQQHADLMARLKNSRETEQRLQTIVLQRTGKISDVLAVEEEIARVRGQIERMEAEQKSLEHRVDFAAVDLRLAEEYQAQLTAPSPSLSIRLRNAIVKGYRTSFETGVGIVLLFLEFGPTLFLWLVICFPVGWFLRRRWLRAQTLAS